MQYFKIFQDKLHSGNIHEDKSWAFSETVQKISKITYTASSSHFCIEHLNRVTLQHNKKFIMFIFSI